MDAATPTSQPLFAELATREGLVRLDQRFLTFLEAEDAALHARLLTARAAPAALEAKAESELLVALGAHLESFVAEVFDIEAAVAALATETRRLDPIHACKRLFVQRQAVKKYPDPAGFDGAALRAALEAAIAATADRTRVRRGGGAVGAGRRRRTARRGAALRRLGDTDASGSGCASRRHAVPCSPQGRSAASGAVRDHRARRRHHAPAAGARLAPARRVRADRRRDEHAAGAGPGQLLHLVPYAGQGFLQQGAEGSQDRRVSEERVRRNPRRLPAR